MEARWKPKKYVCDGGCGGWWGVKMPLTPFYCHHRFSFHKISFLPSTPSTPSTLIIFKKLIIIIIIRETESGKQSLI